MSNARQAGGSGKATAVGKKTETCTQRLNIRNVGELRHLSVIKYKVLEILSTFVTLSQVPNQLALGGDRIVMSRGAKLCKETLPYAALDQRTGSQRN